MKNKVRDSTTLVTKYIKPIYQHIVYRRGTAQKLVMIMGCQRSGTTLLSRVLDSFWFTATFGEFSKLSSNCPNGIRWNNNKEVQSELAATPAPVIITKPLVESHRARELLTEFEGSQIIWLYRHYIDVALSDIQHFPNTGGHGNIRPIVEGNASNWRSECLPTEIIEVVKEVYSESLSELDCACLFWWVRNSLFFYQGLHEINQVLLWKYEDLVIRPKEHFEQLSTRLNRNFIDYPFNKVFSQQSIKKNYSEDINQDIENLCSELLSRLDFK